MIVHDINHSVLSTLIYYSCFVLFLCIIYTHFLAFLSAFGFLYIFCLPMFPVLLVIPFFIHHSSLCSNLLYSLLSYCNCYSLISLFSPCCYLFSLLLLLFHLLALTLLSRFLTTAVTFSSPCSRLTVSLFSYTFLSPCSHLTVAVTVAVTVTFSSFLLPPSHCLLIFSFYHSVIHSLSLLCLSHMYILL